MVLAYCTKGHHSCLPVLSAIITLASRGDQLRPIMVTVVTTMQWNCHRDASLTLWDLTGLVLFYLWMSLEPWNNCRLIISSFSNIRLPYWNWILSNSGVFKPMLKMYFYTDKILCGITDFRLHRYRIRINKQQWHPHLLISGKPSL